MRIDPNIKKEADEVAQMMEITTADAVRIFLDGFAEEKNFL
ncbi:type II toxin-antitoxin system RelB/DinJ family antitoxin [Parasutterella excrementihominis]